MGKRNSILLLMVMMLFASCFTKKKALRQSMKASVVYPGAFAELTARLYPPRVVSSIETKYLQGKDSVVYRTDTMECDSAGQIVYVPKYKEVFRVDTFYSRQVDSVEDTKHVEAVKVRLAESEQRSVKAQLDANFNKGKLKEARRLNWLLGGGMAAMIVGMVLGIKFKIFEKW